jgi:hypothetical protein
VKRPIINIRDEPYADPEKYRRLHVIIGDASMSEVSTYFKVGTTSLVLAMIEDKFLGRDLLPVIMFFDEMHSVFRTVGSSPSRRLLNKLVLDHAEMSLI